MTSYWVRCYSARDERSSLKTKKKRYAEEGRIGSNQAVAMSSNPNGALLRRNDLLVMRTIGSLCSSVVGGDVATMIERVTNGGREVKWVLVEERVDNLVGGCC